MTRGRVDLSRATAAPRVVDASPTYRRVLRGDRLELECRVAGEPAPACKWSHIAASGGVRALGEEGGAGGRAAVFTKEVEVAKKEGEKDEAEEEEADKLQVVSRVVIDKLSPADAGE